MPRKNGAERTVACVIPVAVDESYVEAAAEGVL